MADHRMTFVLAGRDQLSRVLRGVETSAGRLERRLVAAATVSSSAMDRLSRNTARRMADMERDADAGGRAIEALKGSLISLAPAAIPAAAAAAGALAPIVAGTGAAAVAAGAYALALGPQIGAMTEASEAEKKYADAVAKSGRASQEAVQAEEEYHRLLADMPPATRRAAAGLGVLKDEYADWSDDLAKDTLAPFNKGLAITSGLLPKTSGLVRGTSSELDRMMTIAAGAMNTPGFDKAVGRFEKFATGTLAKVNRGLVDLYAGRGDAGKIAPGAREFMEYAQAQGPLVADTLANIGRAIINVLRAGSEVGVSALEIVNAISGIVAAAPPEAITMLLQLAIAVKAVNLAAAGGAAARTALAGLGAQLVAMQTAAGGVPGRLAAARAAIAALSRTAKMALAGTGIGLLLIGLGKLNSMAQTTPPNVDKLATSFKNLAASGKESGELERVFGGLDGIGKAARQVRGDMAELDSVRDWAGLVGLGKAADGVVLKLDSLIRGDSSFNAAKEKLASVDKALAQMATSGHAAEAASGFEAVSQAMRDNGASTKDIAAAFPEYKAALASAKVEQQLAAQAMGVFGTQAQQVQAKLDTQKRSADGLAQSINALSTQYLQARGGIRGMEAAIDAATAAIKKNGRTLDEGTEKGRANNQALDDLASATMKAAESARQGGQSWSQVNALYARGRGELVKSAQAMGLTEAQARKLAGQILKTPNKTAQLKGNMEDLRAKLAEAKSKLASVPDSRKAAVRAQISDLQAKVRQAKADLASLRDRSVTVTTRYVTVGDGSAARRSGSSGSQLKYANGGLVGYPGGGLIEGPGSGTSDSIIARVSNGEFVVRARSVARYGVAFLRAINEGRLGMSQALSGGAMGGAGRETARGLAIGMTGATGTVEAAARMMASAVEAGVRAELEIASPSKKTKTLAKHAGKGFIDGLTGSRDKIKATAKAISKDIYAAFTGSKDDKLVAKIKKGTTKLLAAAKERDKIAATIKRAKDFAESSRVTAKKAASLGSMFDSEETVSAGNVRKKLKAKLAKIKQFSAFVKTLAKRGLNKTMLREIMEMGPEDGYAYASALAGADKATFKEINKTQYAINAEAEKLGKRGADALYDSGKNAGKGFLKGLESQQKAIEKQMEKIAKGMQKAIRKALGIKSPSRVLAEIGRYSSEGLAVGLTEGRPAVDRAMVGVAGAVAGVQPVIGRPVTHGSGTVGGQPVSIQIDVHGAMDPVAVGREIQRTLLHLKRSHGVNVNLGVA
ncbi:hypothetical protein ACWGMW_03095 [Streptomyces albidoflavus]